MAPSDSLESLTDPNARNLCTWSLYRDGGRIINGWAANTGSTPIGRIEIGDTLARTLTINFDDVIVELVPGS